MFQYKFMVIAFIVAILLGISLPLLGTTAVYKRLSMSGDALAHSSLAGVAIGLASGLNPLITSMISCVVAFLIIEFIRRKFQKFSEISVAVVLSFALGLAGILSNASNVSNFDSYLFGSILLVNDLELYLVIAFTIVTVLFFFFLYDKIFLSLYSEDEAKVQGLKVNVLNFFESLLLSLVVAVSAKTIGSLVVSSMIVLPIAAALVLKLSYKKTLFLSIALSLISMIGGLVISYYAGTRSGATIVMVATGELVLLLLSSPIVSHFKKKNSSLKLND
ncbi:MAG: metal ABC transporter permease [Bacilli bacterium]